MNKSLLLTINDKTINNTDKKGSTINPKRTVKNHGDKQHATLTEERLDNSLSNRHP